MTFLEKIVEEKKKELYGLTADIVREYKARAKDIPKPREFLRVFDGKGTKIIAEIKRASPSKGIICKDFNPVNIARIYEENGACALSIITERRFFKGNISYIASVKNKVSLPILRKDFILDEGQIWETLISGADAILLIARLLTEEELKGFVSLSKEIGLTPFVEVHDEKDIEKALLTDTPLIGVNNRDLTTFETDIGVSLRLKPLIPQDRLTISESGIKDRRDIETLEGKGFSGFLIGESLLRDSDIGGRLRGFLGIT